MYYCDSYNLAHYYHDACVLDDHDGLNDSTRDDYGRQDYRVHHYNHDPIPDDSDDRVQDDGRDRYVLDSRYYYDCYLYDDYLY